MLRKVKAVAGDIGSEKLGLSDEDERKLEQQVHIIFHIAAILKLDADIKDAVNMNTCGTLRLLQLATRMKKLQVNRPIHHTRVVTEHLLSQIRFQKMYPTSP